MESTESYYPRNSEIHTEWFSFNFLVRLVRSSFLKEIKIENAQEMRHFMS